MGIIGIGRLAGALFLAIALIGGRAQAQDTSLMDMNMDMGCMIMAGMHELRVSAYQHSSDARRDECEEIAAPGPVSITINTISHELRDLPIEIRMIRDVGPDAEAEAGKLDQITLAHLPPKIYPTGVATFPVNLDKPGKYAILVTVTDEKEKGMVMTGRHVITVEQPAKKWILVLIASGVVLAAGAAFYIWDERRRKLAGKSA
ncbi:hypothetical protein [Methylocapsa aurea]|uniref:hypothetical protein n=1 Tax=Methylocapsa aurea TaxID=663610 RepID=UPI00068AB53B|nr:hypothetical protein [Methylocapsa aurea]